MPHWTKDNVMRICFQFYDQEETYEEREMIRWVLTYPAPQEFALFTPQMANHETVYQALQGNGTANIFGSAASDLNNITAFCALPHWNNASYDAFGTTETWEEPEELRLLQQSLTGEEALEQELRAE